MNPATSHKAKTPKIETDPDLILILRIRAESKNLEDFSKRLMAEVLGPKEEPSK